VRCDLLTHRSLQPAVGVVALESHYTAAVAGAYSGHADQSPDVLSLLRCGLCAGVFLVSREQLESLDTDALLDMRADVQAELDQRSPTLVRQLEAIRVRLDKRTKPVLESQP
jgi:hypothetical protein